MRLARAAFVAAAIVLLAAPAAAQERILSFDSEVRIQADGSLDVTERIRVMVEGQRIRRGIVRDFPTTYRDHRGNRHVVGFELLGVERNGRPEPHFTEQVAEAVEQVWGVGPGVSQELAGDVGQQADEMVGSLVTGNGGD